MARPGTMYRAHRRNAVLGAKPKGVWPKDGVQLDPVYYRPTADYQQQANPTTTEMFAAGKRWLRERIIGRPKL